MLRGLVATVVVLLCTVAAWGELTPEQVKEAQALIGQFTSPEFAVRQKAVEELIKMGPGVLTLMRKTLADTKDDEVKLRCQMVIDDLTKKQGVEQKAELGARKLVEKRVKSLGPVERVMMRNGAKRVPMPIVAWNPGRERLAYVISEIGNATVFLDGEELGNYEAAASFRFSPDGKHYNYDVLRDGKWVNVHDGKEGTGYASPRAPILFSSDSQHLAYAVRLGEDRWTLVYDGKEGPIYDAIGQIKFSPDGKHLAYVARRGDKDYVVLDGKELLFDNEAKPFEPYDKAMGGPTWSLGHPVFSPDSQRMAYICTRDGSQFITCNGEEGPWCDEVSYPTFSPDSKHMAYTAKRGEKMFVVCDGKEGEAYKSVGWRLVFSSDGKVLVYAAYRDGKCFLVRNGKEEWTPYEGIYEPVLSPDDRRVAYWGKRDGLYVMVCDGKEEDATDEIILDSTVFSPDSKRLAYVTKTEGKCFVVCGKVKSQGYGNDKSWGVMRPFFTPDSKHVISQGWRENPSYVSCVIVDGVESPIHAYTRLPYEWESREEWLGQLKDGGKPRYLVVDDDGDDDGAWVVEAEWPKAITDVKKAASAKEGAGNVDGPIPVAPKKGNEAEKPVVVTVAVKSGVVAYDFGEMKGQLAAGETRTFTSAKAEAKQKVLEETKPEPVEPLSEFARGIKLVGVQPDGSDDILDGEGRKIGEMFFSGLRGNGGYWGTERMHRTFIFELPKTKAPALMCGFAPVRISQEKRGLGGSVGTSVVEHEGKLLFLYDLTLDRSFREGADDPETGKRVNITKLIERVDLTVRFYHGPPGKPKLAFTGPFKAGTMVRPDDGGPYKMTLLPDLHGRYAQFRLVTKEPFVSDDMPIVVYDTQGERHIHLGGSGSSGSSGSDKTFVAEDLPLRRIAKITFGEMPQERTFENILVAYPDRPARDYAVYLDEMSKRLGRPVKDIAEHSLKTPEEAVEVADLLRGWHIARAQQQLYSLKFGALPKEKQERLLAAVTRWANAPNPSTRVVGVELGMRRFGALSGFSGPALKLLDDEDPQVRSSAAQALRSYKRLTGEELEQIKNRMLARDDPATQRELRWLLCWAQDDEVATRLWELARAKEDRPWLWWPALGRLGVLEEIEDPGVLGREIRLRLILTMGTPLRGEEHLAEEAYQMLPGLLTPKLREMDGEVWGDVYTRMVEHADRAAATGAMVGYMRVLDGEYRDDAYLLDRMVKQLNLWHVTNLGGRGWDGRQESEDVEKQDWQSIVGEVLRWHEAGAARPERKGAPARFGAVEERSVNGVQEKWNCAFDLDVGDFVPPPEDLKLSNLTSAERDTLEAWCKRSEVDAICHGSYLVSQGMTTSPVPDEFWDTGTLAEIETALSTAVPNGNALGISYRGSAPVTFAFRTREGGTGLLQIPGPTDDHKGIKIRYKMLKGGEAAPDAQ